MLSFRKSNELIQIQGPDSDLLKFEKSLCINCNTTRSAKMDVAYSKVIEYYINNDEIIRSAKGIDFGKVFNSSWAVGKKDFYRYCVKHVCCRLVEGGVSPSQNLINFLSETESLKDVKFVFQIKRYTIGDIGEEIFHLYAANLNRFEQKHLFIGKKMTAVSSWYTIKQFSINYLFRLGIVKSDKLIFSNHFLPIDLVSFSKFDPQQIQLDPELPFQSYGNMIEDLEYYPFTGSTRDLLHYNYLMKYPE